jgi:hypothetical protein
MRNLLLIIALIGSLLFLGGCDKDDDDVFEIHPFIELGIPYGHLPPPGECKIWIPGLPAGQQGPPESCESAFFNAPLGAWVISRTENRYEVSVLSDSRPQVVIEVRYYALP